MAEFFSIIMDFGFFILFFVFAILIAIYVLLGVFLNKFNKLVEGKGTALAWIPIANLYLLGKLLLNKGFGWGVLIASIVFSVLTSSTTITIGEKTTSYSILGEPATTIVSTIWGSICLALIIWAIVKYFQTKKSSNQTQITNTNSNINPNSELGTFLNQDSNQNQNLNQNQNQNQNQTTNQNQNINEIPNQSNNFNQNDSNGSTF